MSEDRQAAGSSQESPSTQTGEATPPSAGARSPGRRGFLLGVGGMAAAALVGPGGWLGSSQVTSAGPASTRPRPVGSGSALAPEARRARALQLRITTAQQQLRDPFPQPRPNGDEDRHEVLGLANFTKALPRNDLGEVDLALPGAAPGAARRPVGGLQAHPAGRQGEAGQPRGRVLLRAAGA